MLSRVADSLYWMSRYLERAENTARQLDVTMNLMLDPGRRIVQAWRTTRFTADDPDSQIEVLLEPAPEGSKLTLHHTNIPDGHTGYQNGGWQEHYFEPMKRYFGGKR